MAAPWNIWQSQVQDVRPVRVDTSSIDGAFDHAARTVDNYFAEQRQDERTKASWDRQDKQQSALWARQDKQRSEDHAREDARYADTRADVARQQKLLDEQHGWKRQDRAEEVAAREAAKRAGQAFVGGDVAGAQKEFYSRGDFSGAQGVADAATARRESELKAAGQLGTLAKDAASPEELGSLLGAMKARGYDTSEFDELLKQGPAGFEAARNRLRWYAQQSAKKNGVGHAPAGSAIFDQTTGQIIQQVPQKPEGALTEKQKIDMIQDSNNARQRALSVMAKVEEAAQLNKKAYPGGLIPEQWAQVVDRTLGSDDASATIQLSNILKSIGLENLKVIFGGNPTEGERAAMEAITGNVQLSRENRAKILQRLYEAVEDKAEFERLTADAIRKGTYLSSDIMEGYDRFREQRRTSRGGQKPAAPRMRDGATVEDVAADVRMYLGMGHSVERIVERLKQAGIDPASIQQILAKQAPQVPTGR